MQTEEYFRSLSAECVTLKNRVRMLIEDQHWPTDGEWKESVLRNMIRRSAPETITVGRGFVVSHAGSTSQIDVLLYDNTYPALYRDGDLVFVTPDACRGIVEVKTRVTLPSFRDAVGKLAENAHFIRRSSSARPLFAGLFSYEAAPLQPATLLARLQATAAGQQSRVIDHVALSSSTFIKFWPQNPETDARPYNQWHCYDLHDMAAGYFIHNLLDKVASNPPSTTESAWFPRRGKEVRLVARSALQVRAAGGQGRKGRRAVTT